MSTKFIQFHLEGVDLENFDQKKASAWISNSIHQEGKTVGAVNFVFCTDEYLLSINQEYLNHNTYTDIVTFNYVENNCISGDLFISTERVKENASLFKCSFQNELHRVMIHGILHLIGYNDKTNAESLEIRAKEDFYLTLFSKLS